MFLVESPQVLREISQAYWCALMRLQRQGLKKMRMLLKNPLVSIELPWKNITRSSIKPFYITFDIFNYCDNC